MNSFNSDKKATLQEPIPEDAVVNKGYLEQLNSSELLFCGICLGLLVLHVNIHFASHVSINGSKETIPVQ